jgi:hypothetical protein
MMCVWLVCVSKKTFSFLSFIFFYSSFFFIFFLKEILRGTKSLKVSVMYLWRDISCVTTTRQKTREKNEWRNEEILALFIHLCKYFTLLSKKMLNSLSQIFLSLLNFLWPLLSSLNVILQRQKTREKRKTKRQKTHTFSRS